MTRVGRRGCITAAQARGQRIAVDVPIPAAVSHCFEFSIPIRRRQPNLDLDIGFARRFQCRRNPAERGQVAELRSTTSSSTACRRKPARSHGLRQGDSRIRQLESRKTFAWRGRRRKSDQQEDQQHGR